MLTALIRRRGTVLLGTALLVATLLVLAVVAFGGGADVVVYNGRSQYGDEAVFKAFEDATGKKLELRGGTAPELFEPVHSAKLDRQVPEPFRDSDGEWYGLSLRVRTPMRSTKLPADAVTSYADLGDARWNGRLCLRTSNNEYNQSLVADMLAKRGRERTQALLEAW